MRNICGLVLACLLAAVWTTAAAGTQTELPEGHEAIMAWAEAYAEEMEALRETQERLEAERGVPFYLWTLEEKFALYETYREAIESAPNFDGSVQMPEEADMSLADALALSMETVAEAYGEHAVHLMDPLHISINFLVFNDGRRTWEINFFRGPVGDHWQAYYTSIDAATGKVTIMTAQEDDPWG